MKDLNSSVVDYDLDEFRKQSEQIMQKGSKTFSFASLFFDKKIFADVVLLYRWCRFCDDQIDLVAPEKKLERLNFLIEQTKCAILPKSESGNLSNFQNDAFFGLQTIYRKYNLNQLYIFDLLEGMKQDVDHKIYKNFDELDQYCYYVAGTVGLLMTQIMGVEITDDVKKHAVDLGKAMQLTNIARDVYEDAGGGRVFIPCTVLNQCGIDISDLGLLPAHILDIAQQKNVERARALILERAKQYYRSGELGVSLLPYRCALAVMTASRIYAQIGQVISDSEFERVRERAVVSLIKKIKIFVESFISVSFDFFLKKYGGIFFGLLSIAGWIFLTFYGLLSGNNFSKLNLLWMIPLLVQANTFLFITAHDSMHGLVSENKFLNHLIGRLTLILYAMMSYEKLEKSHHEHHRFPVSSKDPDHYSYENRSQKSNFWFWYFRFMLNYFSLSQFLSIFFVVQFVSYFISVEKILLYWAIPAILSSLQLFYFGTFLTHREPKDGFLNEHKASSNDYSYWISFLTCFHFGYHLEHHEKPSVPWWRLPSIRKNDV